MNKYTYLLFALILSICSVEAQNKLIFAEPLPNTINKPDTDELAPVVSKDGKTMFFVRGRKETDLAKKEKIGQDIYFSTFENGNWTEAKKVEGKINNKSHNVVCGINDKGDRLYLSNTYINEKGKMHRGVSISQKEGNEWGKPQDVEIDGLEDVDINMNSHFYFFMAKDESYIIISKHEENSKGEEDLYISKDSTTNKKGQKIYSKPIPLGNQINSKGFETSPYMVDDMTLVFASNRGSIDSIDSHNHSEGRIYFSKRQDKNDWTKWSDAKPIEEYNKDWAVLNSERNFDAYWFPHDDVKDGKMEYCYFVSDRNGGQGAADIWKLNVSYQLKVNVFACDENGKQTTVKVPAKVTIEGLEADMKGDTLTFLKASFDKPYRLKAIPEDDKKYKSYNEEITITAKDYKNEFTNRFFTSKDICLTPIIPKIDSARILTKVYFLYDKYAMNETVAWAQAANDSVPDTQLLKSRETRLGVGIDTLKRIIEFLNTEKGQEYEIKLVGYADSIGTIKKNIELSINRTNTIKDYLVKNGFDARRILPTEIKVPSSELINVGESKIERTEGDNAILKAYGLGEANHVKVNGGIKDEARRQQRRVEIQAFKKKIIIN